MLQYQPLEMFHSVDRITTTVTSPITKFVMLFTPPGPRSQSIWPESAPPNTVLPHSTDHSLTFYPTECFLQLISGSTHFSLINYGKIHKRFHVYSSVVLSTFRLLCLHLQNVFIWQNGNSAPFKQLCVLPSAPAPDNHHFLPLRIRPLQAPHTSGLIQCLFYVTGSFHWT